MANYTPSNWHWIVGGDESRFWSSAAATYVEVLPDGAGVTRILDESELTDVLAVYGLVGPVARIPQAVSAAQAKLALDAAGILDDVEAMIAAHPVRAVRIWFADANIWERWHPYVAAFGLEMSLDDDDIDALFVVADLY